MVTQEVGRGKKPAAAGRLLGCDRSGRGWNGEIEYVRSLKESSFGKKDGWEW